MFLQIKLSFSHLDSQRFTHNFKIPLIHYVHPFWNLNHCPIFLWLNELAKFTLNVLIFLTKKLWKYFFMVVLKMMWIRLNADKFYLKTRDIFGFNFVINFLFLSQGWDCIHLFLNIFVFADSCCIHTLNVNLWISLQIFDLSI